MVVPLPANESITALPDGATRRSAWGPVVLGVPVSCLGSVVT